MQAHTLVALAAQGFKGVDGLTLATSLQDKGMVWQKGQEYYTFLYETDANSPTNSRAEYAFGVIEIDATAEEEFFWVTMEQWHKIAEARGRDVAIVLSLSLPEITFLVYDHFGATPIFASPSEPFTMEETSC